MSCGFEYYIMEASGSLLLQEESITMMKKEELLEGILKTLDNMGYIKSEDIPNIDLYMDQVTTFMDSKLAYMSRKPETDKILTKTMINNYAKNDLLPPPVKKKYSKEHMILLLFIYYYKGILSINDIQTLLGPITEKFFHKDGVLSMEQLYEEVFGMEKGQIDCLKKDMEEKLQVADQTFQDMGLPAEEAESMQIFSFICLLSFDVYVKKLIIERMIDAFSKEQQEREEKNGDRKK